MIYFVACVFIDLNAYSDGGIIFLTIINVYVLVSCLIIICFQNVPGNSSSNFHPVEI